VSPYWALDLLPVSGVNVQHYFIGYAGLSAPVSYVAYGPAVVNPAAFGRALTVSQASWMVLPQAPAMARGNIEALNAGTSEAVSQLSVLLPKGLNVTSGLPQLLDGTASTIVLTRSLFTIAALQLLPREMTGRLGMRNRVEVQEEPDHIGFARYAEVRWIDPVAPVLWVRSVIRVTMRRSSMTARPCSAISDASRGSQGLSASGPVSGVDSPLASPSR